MEAIASFEVDHIRMSRGIFVSRRDRVGDKVLTTFDIRMKEPNREPVMDVPGLHSIEHLGATILRNDKEWGDRMIYFGPMGCRTGYYLILAGDLRSEEALPLVQSLFRTIINWNDEVPGASAACCGNWRDHNLDMAHWESGKFMEEVLDNPQHANLHYPD
ncbi:S-ribosylhomocysteine lyase [Candidatus Haliotispira prima]|uniref:S-ribosylhomocysteine lyase n=1 Tax=Candidatus Haliotispira prima TaxID=3034016 RepID=A0ABY8MJR2_9SPIO|nr:S-ribosylhomocysteine lyase [Candidatus Haliotispira prima]